MATKNAKDNYPAAALRHFHDAEILKNVHSYENAFCHYAFSVECAQKTLLYWHNNSTPSKHGIVDDWNDVSLLLQARKTLDSILACTVPATPFPPKLAKDHPQRRYQKCFHINKKDMDDAQKFAQNMEQTIINMIIDGLIHV